MSCFIIAPDSFKGTMSAKEVCGIVAACLREKAPDAQIINIPMSDGGEGMVDSYLNIIGGQPMTAQVTGPRGAALDCVYGVLPNGSAVMEMASCAGLMLMESKLDPMHATTRGVGELLLLLEKAGHKKVLMGIGGSATNDCGVGMAHALGYRFLDVHGAELEPYACNIGQIQHIVRPDRLCELDITVACDVDNPLCGERGASAVFGPQKGLRPEQIAPLDEDIRRFALLIKKELGADVLDMPGAGAAGGLGAALVAFCGARLTPGIEMLLDASGIDSLLESAQLVITGEGRMDYQSASGKVPVGVGRRAKKAGVACIAVCGCLGPGYEAVLDEGVVACYPATDGTKSFEEILKSCREDLAAAARRAFAEHIKADA